MHEALVALSFGGALTDVGRSFREAFTMLADTLWALVVGFALSGAVQAFVPRSAMERRLGSHRPGAVVLASLYGMASSSCSYAASAVTRSLVAKGADFLTALAFLFASTNLVVELGVVLLALLGWQFLAAEYVGGVVMIVALVVVGAVWFRGRTPVVVPAAAPASGHQASGHQASGHQACGSGDDDAPDDTGWRQRVQSVAGWSDAAGYALSDLRMVGRELVIGFVVAGFLSVLVPPHVWADVFVRGHGGWTRVENAAIAPAVAVASFVCSIGNVPLAAALWSGGVSFGGVVAFVFADLVTFPLLLVYAKQYGRRSALRMLALFWLVMSGAGLLTEALFRAAGWVPTARPGHLPGTTVRLDATTVADIVALVAFGGLVALHRAWSRSPGRTAPVDPVCGMRVDPGTAPAHATAGGRRYHFCSEHCRDRFLANPARYGADASVPDERAGPTTTQGR